MARADAGELIGERVAPCATAVGAIERRKPRLFAQTIIVPPVGGHRILAQVARQRMNVFEALTPLMIFEQERRWFTRALAQLNPTLAMGRPTT